MNRAALKDAKNKSEKGKTMSYVENTTSDIKKNISDKNFVPCSIWKKEYLIIDLHFLLATRL